MPKTREPPCSMASPWRRATVIYAILALGVFAYPGGMANWLDERNTSGWLVAPVAVMRALDAASGAIGVKEIGDALRRRFAAWIGEDQT